MRDLIRRIGTQAAAARGLTLVPTDPPLDVIETLSALWPVDTGHKLIRVGGELDGGYLVPDDLDGIVACFSPGVGGSASFEADLRKRSNIPIHLCDRDVLQKVGPF
jgi:hypothetical protein